MKSLARWILVTTAAIALVTVAFACDGEKKVAGAGCHDSGAKAEAGGCPHAEAAAMKADAKGAGCSHSEVSEAQRAALAKGSNVTLVGRVVCASCDLKSAKDCKSMFKTEDGQLYAIVTSEAFEKLASETRHGEKKIEVVATSAKDGETAIVQVQSFKILS